MRRGTGLMAGSPGGTGRPGLVTVPTPGPALKVTPVPGTPGRTVAETSAPCVTSGSSPASFTMPAVASPTPDFCKASAKAGVAPPGKVTSTGSGNSPVINAVQAAFAAAAAQVPVVQPRRKGFCLEFMPISIGGAMPRVIRKRPSHEHRKDAGPFAGKNG